MIEFPYILLDEKPELINQKWFEVHSASMQSLHCQTKEESPIYFLHGNSWSECGLYKLSAPYTYERYQSGLYSNN